MRSSATLAILVLLGFLSSGCCASTCANFSLPNFLDVGKCLKKSGDLCSANTQGVVEFLEDLTRCLFEGIATLDLGNQFYLLYNYLLYLLDRNDFVQERYVSARSGGRVFYIAANNPSATQVTQITTDVSDIVLPAIKDLCKSFNTATGGLITLSCDALKFKKNAVCGKPIFISFVTSTPFAKCLDVTGLTCDENKPVDEPAVIGFLRVLASLYDKGITAQKSTESFVCYTEDKIKAVHEPFQTALYLLQNREQRARQKLYLGAYFVESCCVNGKATGSCGEACPPDYTNGQNLSCLTGYILNTSPSDTYKVLVCFIVTFFLRIFGPLGFIVFRTPLCAFLKAVRVTCSSIRC